MFLVNCSSVPIFGNPLAVYDDVIRTRNPMEVFDGFEPFLRPVFGLHNFEGVARDVDEVSVHIGGAEAVDDWEDRFPL